MLIKQWGIKDNKGKPRIRVLLKCDDCGKESETSIDNYYQYKKRNGGDITYCKPCSGIRGGAKNKGKPCKQKGIPKPYMQREKSSNWKGGRYVSKDGYYMILVESGPNVGNGWKKYRKEHIVLIEESIGRKLEKEEVVHHIDGDKLNNQITNLDLIDNDINHHRNTHSSLQEVGYKLYKSGIIGYDKITHRYYIKES